MIIGHYINCGDAACLKCYTPPETIIETGEITENDPAPIFSTTESDSPVHCYNCDELIPCRMTDDGIIYIQDAIENFIVTRDGIPNVVAAWWFEYGHSLENADLHCLLDNAFGRILGVNTSTL